MKHTFLTLLVAFGLAGFGFAQNNVAYQVVADTNDVFVHLRGGFLVGDMWVSNMNIGSNLGAEVGINKRMRFSGNIYWAHAYDGGLSAYNRDLADDGVVPVKVAGPTAIWDLGFGISV